MPKNLIGAIALFLVICGVSIGVRVVKPVLDSKKKSETSLVGQSKGVIRIGGDAYAGYFPLTSDEMKNRMLKDGYRIEYQDDGGDYAQRTKKLKDKAIDLAVFTVDSYLLNGVAENYPGSIIAVLSESKGSDAIVANTKVIQSLDDLKTKQDTKIAFTENSPSHHLLKTVGVHFGLPHLLDNNGTWRLPANGSTEALKKLEKGEASVAVLWEPEIARATVDTRFEKLLGTESTSGLIVDILVANRDFLQEKPEVIEAVLKHYFLSLKTYRRDNNRFVKELAAWSDVSKDKAAHMIDGISWISLYKNASTWYGIEIGDKKADFQLYKNIEATLATLIEAGDFSRSPLLNGDPRSIIFEDFIKQLAFNTLSPSEWAEAGAEKAVTFNALSPQAWNQLQPVGTLKIPPVQFQSSSLELSDSSKKEMQTSAALLRQYPSFRVLVEGHTSPRGDAQANIELSQQRAEAVTQYLIDTFNFDTHRIHAVGQGAQQPLPRGEDESYRAYLNRLARVEIKFVADPI